MSEIASMPAQAAAGSDDVYVFPASAAQRRIWFVERLGGAGASYALAGAMRLRGPLDDVRLERALEELVRRHESLRTGLVELDGDVVQVVEPACAVSLAATDLRALPVAARAAEALRLAIGHAGAAFDLARPPLLRALLLRLDEREHMLCVCVHHAVADGASIAVLVGELADLYAGRPVPEPGVQFADVAVWECGLGDAGVSAWVEELRGVPVLRLPADGARSASSARGGRVAVDVPAAVFDGLDALARAAGVTPFVAWLAAFAGALSRWSGQRDFAVGFPVSNRDRAELANVVGCLANVVALRADLSGAPSIRELVTRCGERVAATRSHWGVPFERVVEAIEPERERGRHPLFSVLLDYQTAMPWPGEAAGELVLEPVELDLGSAKFDLTLEVGERGCALEYDADLFSPAAAQLLATQLAAFLRAAVAAPGRAVSRLDLGDGTLIAGWNATATTYRGAPTLHGLVEQQVARTPDAIALVCGGDELSFGELDARAGRLAGSLAAAGAGPGSVVGVRLERSLDLVVALLAVLKAGAAYLPLDPELPEARLRWMVDDAGATLVLPGAGDGGRSAAPAGPATVGGDDVAYVIYTSGSTGRPKGVMVCHAAIRNRLLWMQDAFGLRAGEGVLQKTPIGFDVSVWELFWPLIAGARMVLAAPGGHRDPSYLAALMTAQDVGTAHFVPSMLEAFVASGDAPSCRSLRRVIASGEALPAQLVERFHGLGLDAELHNLYGPTEAAVDVTAWHCRRGERRDPVPIGRPIANVRTHVLDEHGHETPVGVAGELFLAGAQVARGYLGRPRLTAERFVPDPFGGEAGARMYRTGDRARWRADGTLEFLGRLDGQVKVRGHRIELGEVEAALRRDARVREAATIVRGEGDQRALHAFVTTTAPVQPGELRDALRAELPAPMVPATITCLAALPTTANGKLDRGALPVPGAAQPEPGQPPRGATEEALAAIFAELLGVTQIARRDDFFALGGHSLLALRLLSRIAAQLQAELVLADVFDAPVLARLAERVERARGATTPNPIVRAAHGGPLPLSHSQERIWLMQELDPGGVAYNLAGAVRLRGPLDRTRLAQALAALEQRHDALRTRIVRGADGTPQQVLEPPSGLAPAFEDLSRLDAAQREPEAACRVAAEARRPFDLERAPLVRVRVLRLADDDHVLAVCLHHVVADGWSVGLLVRDLAALYAGAQLPAIALQPGDVALWERELGDAGTAFWARELAGLAPLALPAGAPEPAARAQAVAAVAPEVSRAVQALARDCGVTPFVVWLAGYAAALSAWSGQQDFGIGVPVANRERPELASVVGCLVNVVVVRVQMDRATTFRALVERLGERVAAGRPHWRVPFERVVAAAAPARRPGRHPLFQVLFDHQSGPELPAQAGDLALAEFPAGDAASQFELALYLRDDDDGGGGGARATMTFGAGALAAASPDALVALLAGAVAQPDRPLAAPHLATTAAPAPPPPAAAQPAVVERPRSATQRAIAAAWSEVLGLEQAPAIAVNFFDAGGNSLSLVRVRALLERALERRIELVDLFRHPTIEALGAHLDGGAPAGAGAATRRATRTAEPIAIVGMAGRFPGAGNVEALWRNLCDGVESISFFSPQELAAAGVDPALAADARYVPAGGVLDDVERFDAELFGYSAAEADALDPQGRVLLECGWEALEDAGHDPARHARVGVFAGATLSTYMLRRLAGGGAVASARELLLAGDKDYVASRLSYKLGLTGPSVSVQTACSTSLVAVQMACESLRSGQCELALAGGVSITVPQRVGYLFEEGGIESPDGHCRAFDARAAGTVGGNGAALVVLKPLARAQADGDTIRAVILGAAVNNDGARKVGFTAPSVDGQAAVIAAAQDEAGIAPRSIGYVEAHGTGTALGDMVEIAALTQAFGRAGDAPAGICAIGSAKTNLGHLDAAAGVTGLIKAALAVQRGVVPANVHFDAPDPRLGLDGSPFHVARETVRWEPAEGPRRAGVSSFGLGGTNAHVVLEQPPQVAEPPTALSAGEQLLVLSVRTPAALDAAADRLADALEADPGVALEDVAHTLQTGRRELPQRHAIVSADVAGAVAGLRAREGRTGRCAAAGGHAVALLFAGQGAQAPGMAAALYERLPRFRRHADECLALLEPELAAVLAQTVFGRPAQPGAAARLERTALAQPALFVVEHALARVWLDWGVRPAALIGHSLGELVAACVAGVLSLPDALALVVLRGRLMEAAAPGTMLAVPLAPAELEPLLPDGACIAALNAPALTVASGPPAALDALAAALEQRGSAATRLRTSHAFHSAAMDGAVEPFRDAVAACSLSAPQIPWVSNVTGDWIADAQATDPAYWASQLRSPVRLAAGMAALLATGVSALLEVGPGRTMCALARANGADVELLASGARPRDLLAALGSLWVGGMKVDWEAVADAPRRRVALPTYPFERRRHWLDEVPAAPRPDPVGALSVPTWVRAGRVGAGAAVSGRWLVLARDAGPAAALAEQLAALGADVVRVRPGAGYARPQAGSFTADPCSTADLARVLDALERPPDVVVHGLADGTPGQPFASAAALVRAVAASAPAARVELVTTGAYDVAGDEPLAPSATMLQAVALVAPQELPELSCRLVDVLPGQAGALAAELSAPSSDRIVALRGGWRWLPEQRPPAAAAAVPTETLRSGGVYLVTGGLGRVGLSLAEHLALRHGARLALAGRSGAGGAADRVAALRAAGAEVAVETLDVGDGDAVRALARRIEARFGGLDGVVHAAGVAGDGAAVEMLALDATACEQILRAKVAGIDALRAGLAELQPATWILCSSLSSLLGGLGFGAYAAGNLYLDAIATSESRRAAARWISIQWDGWAFAGDADEGGPQRLAPAQAVAALDRIVVAGISGPVAVAASALAPRLERWVGGLGEPPAAAAGRHERPQLSAAYRAPASVRECEVAAVWAQLLGLERVGLDDDFLELGGHSLLATQVVSRLRTSTGLPLTLRMALGAPTVAELAAALDALQWAALGAPEDPPAGDRETGEL